MRHQGHQSAGGYERWRKISFDRILLSRPDPTIRMHILSVSLFLTALSAPLSIVLSAAIPQQLTGATEDTTRTPGLAFGTFGPSIIGPAGSLGFIPVFYVMQSKPIEPSPATIPVDTANEEPTNIFIWLFWNIIKEFFVIFVTIFGLFVLIALSPVPRLLKNRERGFTPTAAAAAEEGSACSTTPPSNDHENVDQSLCTDSQLPAVAADRPQMVALPAPSFAQGLNQTLDVPVIYGASPLVSNVTENSTAEEEGEELQSAKEQTQFKDITTKLEVVDHLTEYGDESSELLKDEQAKESLADVSDDSDGENDSLITKKSST